ncbi:hypothetical protein [Mycolicibacterium sp. 018/SC-01/001]|nr:hypothetical protein [Mycolicibacterium sp. 018/SC-01/001]
MDRELEAPVGSPVWRDPLSAGWRAHRGLLMLRLRWHERRAAGAAQSARD